MSPIYSIVLRPRAPFTKLIFFYFRQQARLHINIVLRPRAPFTKLICFYFLQQARLHTLADEVNMIICLSLNTSGWSNSLTYPGVPFVVDPGAYITYCPFGFDNQFITLDT